MSISVFIVLAVIILLVVISVYFVFFQNALSSRGSSECPSALNIGTYGSGSTGGDCSNYIVNIGAYGTYTNYQSACPSVVNVGTYGIYYNNVTGCDPQVNVGTGAKYYNINVGGIQSTTIIPNTYTTTIPYTTISSSGSCSSFELTESSASSNTSGSCTWSGGYLSVSYSTGALVAITLNITNNAGFTYNIGANNSRSNPLYCLSNSQSVYFPSGTYYVKFSTGASGATCSNNYAYAQLSS